MNMRDRLVELMNQAVMNMPREEYEKEIGMEKVIKCIADYLIQNGVIVQPCRYLQKCFVMEDNDVNE